MIVEKLGPPSWAPQVNIRGRLVPGAEDELEAVLSDPPGFFDAVLDIRGLDELTAEGCEVLRETARRITKSHRRFTVVEPQRGPIHDQLIACGLLDDWRIWFA